MQEGDRSKTVRVYIYSYILLIRPLLTNLKLQISRVLRSDAEKLEIRIRRSYSCSATASSATQEEQEGLRSMLEERPMPHHTSRPSLSPGVHCIFVQRLLPFFFTFACAK